MKKIFIPGVILFGFSIFLHEIFHLFAAIILNIEGTLQLYPPAFVSSSPEFNGWKEILIGLAGGFFAGMLFLLIWLKFRTYLLLLVSLIQFLYAPIDAFFAPHEMQIWWLLSILAISQAIDLLLYIKHPVKMHLVPL